MPTAIFKSWRFWAIVFGVINMHLGDIQTSFDFTLVYQIISEILVGAGIVRTVDRIADKKA